MLLGPLFVLLAFALAALGLLEGGFGYVLLWPALSFALVGAGYLGLGSRVFGKRADGSLPIWSRAVFAPYLGLAWVIWQFLRKTRVRPYDLVAPGLYLARRLHTRELPADVELVVDLTAEFAIPAGFGGSRRYQSLPALDGHVPDEARFAALVDEVARSNAVTLVHCAAGHGRSAGFVAAVLIRRGLAADIDEAEKLIKVVRPSIRIRRSQRALVMRMRA
jgi:protein-tyrosine phosphatase